MFCVLFCLIFCVLLQMEDLEVRMPAVGLMPKLL
jgi:hypothetical protein